MGSRRGRVAAHLRAWRGGLLLRALVEPARREKQAESDKAEALKKEKSEAASKLDQVLALVQKLDQMQSLALRLQAADQLSHQLKGAIDKVEERVDGQGADHKARLQALEALTQRLDERTRIDELTRDTKRRR